MGKPSPSESAELPWCMPGQNLSLRHLACIPQVEKGTQNIFRHVCSAENNPRGGKVLFLLAWILVVLFYNRNIIFLITILCMMLFEHHVKPSYKEDLLLFLLILLVQLKSCVVTLMQGFASVGNLECNACYAPGDEDTSVNPQLKPVWVLCPISYGCKKAN